MAGEEVEMVVEEEGGEFVGHVGIPPTIQIDVPNVLVLMLEKGDKCRA